MTAVKTSPDLRHARVYVSVLGDDARRARRRLDGPALRPRLPAAARRRRAAAQAHADARRSTTTTSIERGHADHRADRPGGRTSERRRTAPTRQTATQVLAELRGAEQLHARHPREPRRRRARLAGRRCSEILSRARQGQRDVHGRGRVPAALRVPLLPARRAGHRRRPTDVDERTIVFLDCGNIDRNPADVLKRDGAHILNIDHHHDNTRFGTVNHVVPEASCTAEIVWDLMRGARRRADADDRRGALRRPGHRHRQVHVREHRHARARDGRRADRRPASTCTRSTGACTRASRTASSSCWRAALANVERYDDGRLTLTAPHAPRTSTQTGAEENYSEGVIDHLRSVEGTAVAALVRDRLGATARRAVRKVSLRATDDRVDVSRIARAQGGGGHRQAAGFSTELGWHELVAFLRAEVAEQLPGRRPPSRRRAAGSPCRTGTSCGETRPRWTA